MIQVVNWGELQHYKGRRPLWIKLYRKLLENPNWHALSGDASKLLAECWLVASEYDAGAIPMDAAQLAWRLRRSDVQRVDVLLQEIVRYGFISYEPAADSKPLATRSTSASPEKRREETKTPLGASADAPVGGVLRRARLWPQSPLRAEDGTYQYPPEFEDAWASYPKRAGSNPKMGAYTAFRSCVLKGSDPALLARAAHNYRQAMSQSGKEGTEYVQQASTFYGKKGTWADYLKASNANGAGPPGTVSNALSPSERRALNSSMKNAEN